MITYIFVPLFFSLGAQAFLNSSISLLDSIYVLSDVAPKTESSAVLYSSSVRLRSSKGEMRSHCSWIDLYTFFTVWLLANEFPSPSFLNLQSRVTLVPCTRIGSEILQQIQIWWISAVESWAVLQRWHSPWFLGLYAGWRTHPFVFCIIPRKFITSGESGHEQLLRMILDGITIPRWPWPGFP